MIEYNVDGIRQLTFVFSLNGSCAPFAAAIALPCALLAASLKLLYGSTGTEPWEHVQPLAQGGGTAMWSGFSFLVGFVIVFRTSQAYSRYWEALTSTHKMLAEWFDAASSLAAFTHCTKASAQEVEEFLFTAVRLFSILSACALQELSDVGEHQTWGLNTLDASSIDDYSIDALDRSPCRVELVYQWVQQLCVDAVQKDILSSPPPIISRTFNELSNGMRLYQDSLKHAKVPFPFPYAQTTILLLMFHWLLTPWVMIRWSDSVLGASVFTFVQVFALWSLNKIATDFERPFAGGTNDIDSHVLQHRMNTQLINLLEPSSRRTPTIDSGTLCNIEVLKQLDTVYGAALIGEGWELKTLETTTSHRRLIQRPTSLVRRCLAGCSRCCCRRHSVAADGDGAKVAVSSRFCQKRYGMIDDEWTAVLTIGIFTDFLFLALPPRASLEAGKGHGGPSFEVRNLAGEPCTLRIKKVPIRERHGLRHRVPQEQFMDFPSQYTFRAEALVSAYHKHHLKGSFAQSHVGGAKQEGQGWLASVEAGEKSPEKKSTGVEEHIVRNGASAADCDTQDAQLLPGMVPSSAESASDGESLARALSRRSLRSSAVAEHVSDGAGMVQGASGLGGGQGGSLGIGRVPADQGLGSGGSGDVGGGGGGADAAYDATPSQAASASLAAVASSGLPPLPPAAWPGGGALLSPPAAGTSPPELPFAPRLSSDHVLSAWTSAAAASTTMDWVDSLGAELEGLGAASPVAVAAGAAAAGAAADSEAGSVLRRSTKIEELSGILHGLDGGAGAGPDAAADLMMDVTASMVAEPEHSADLVGGEVLPWGVTAPDHQRERAPSVQVTPAAEVEAAAAEASAAAAVAAPAELGLLAEPSGAAGADGGGADGGGADGGGATEAVHR